jgi:catalase
MHRQAIHRGRVAYEPNSLGGGCPFQAGMSGFTSFPQPVQDDKLRGKPEKFADHYSQATLFYRSQTPVEQEHIKHALRFELTKVQVPAVRERVVAMLLNVDEDLAASVAHDLGMELPEPLPRIIEPKAPEVAVSPTLSLFARPGDGSIRTRRVGILVAEGLDVPSAMAIQAALVAQGANPRYIGVKLGRVTGKDGKAVDVEITIETMPSVLVDAIVVPGGDKAVKNLGTNGQAAEFIVNAYRHCKPILALGAGRKLVEDAGVPATLPSGESDPGVLLFDEGAIRSALPAFVAAIAKHRHFERQVDPPPV